MEYELKRSILLRNIDNYFTAPLGYEVTDEDNLYVHRLNEQVIARLEERLGDRFHAVGLPIFLVETDNGHEAVPVRVEVLNTVDDLDAALGEIVQQIAGQVLDDDDETLHLYVHSPVLPGGFTQQYNPGFKHSLDRQRWRSRFAVHAGRPLVQPIDHHVSAPRPPSDVAEHRPAGFYPDLNQYLDGTAPTED